MVVDDEEIVEDIEEVVEDEDEEVAAKPAPAGGEGDVEAFIWGLGPLLQLSASNRLYAV